MGQIYTNSLGDQGFYQRVAEGLEPGYSLMEKFGEAPEITTGTDPADLWDASDISGAEIYTFSSSADIDRLSSSNAGDTQDILIQGLDSNWEEVSQTITLTGQTPVTLTTALIRVYRMVNVGATNLAGNVYCFVNGDVTGGVPDTATDIRAMIRDGNNQTLMCIYTVPANKTGYFWGGYVSTSTSVKDESAIFTWRARLYGGVFAVKSKISVMGSGNSSWSYAYKFPIALPEKTDVLIRCDEVSATMALSGGFSVLLKDNN